jgi:histidine phosphotransfer protein HptB
MGLLSHSILDGRRRKDYQCVNNLPLRPHPTPVTDESIAPDVFDRLQKATAADPKELAGLCRDYLAEARHTLTQLSIALAQEDAGRLRDRAHYLRGSSLVIGATAVARCCAALEQMGRNSDFRGAAPLLDQTSVALDAVEAELAKRLAQSVVPVEGSAA